jgi:membrane protease YdiL (CAAX protease family)
MRTGGLVEANPLPAPTMAPRALKLELGLVMVLAFAPSLLSLLLGALAGGGGGSGTTQVGMAEATASMLLTMFLTWSPLLVLAYLLMRNRESSATLGLGRIRGSDLGLAIPLWIVSYVVVLILGYAFQSLGSNDVQFLPLGLPLWYLLVQSVVIAVGAGVTEEIMVRGYAMTRLQQLGAPPAVIVLVPTALWSLLHIYQGPAAVAVIFGLGLVWALWFQRTRRLWPLIIAHALFDLTQLLLLINSSR